MKKVNLLWTGGWDSTFRIIELSLQDVTIQPIYCIDRSRQSYEKEISSMKEILFELKKKPKTKAVINDIAFVDINDIPENPEITMAFSRICDKVKLGGQYEWIARLAAQYPMLEIGVEKPSGEYSGIVTAVKNEGDFIYNGETYVVDSTTSSNDIILVFGEMSFPIVNTTEREMLEYIREVGYENIMTKIWFCHNPIEEQPCGFCRPCQQKMECGMGWLLPKAAQQRYRVYQVATRILGSRIGSKIVTTLYRK